MFCNNPALNIIVLIYMQKTWHAFCYFTKNVFFTEQKVKFTKKIKLKLQGYILVEKYFIK